MLPLSGGWHIKVYSDTTSHGFLHIWCPWPFWSLPLLGNSILTMGSIIAHTLYSNLPSHYQNLSISSSLYVYTFIAQCLYSYWPITIVYIFMWVTCVWWKYFVLIVQAWKVFINIFMLRVRTIIQANMYWSYLSWSGKKYLFHALCWNNEAITLSYYSLVCSHKNLKMHIEDAVKHLACLYEQYSKRFESEIK